MIVNHDLNVDPNGPIPLVRQIYFKLREKIISGELKEGDRLPTLKSLEECLGVSICTVRSAFAMLAKEELIKSVPHLGTFVQSPSGSVVQEPLRLTPEQKHCLRNLNVAIVIKPESESIPRRRASIESFESVVSSYSGRSARMAPGELMQEGVRHAGIGAPNAVLYCCHGTSPYDDEIIDGLLLRGLPMIALGYSGNLKVSRVNEDWDWAMREIMDHLIELGHRRIALATYLPNAGADRYPWALERENAFLEMGRSKGLGIDEGDMYVGNLQDEHGLEKDLVAAGKSLGRQIFAGSRKYTAIVGINDEIARGIMETAAVAGMSIPGDFSLAGFDNIPVSREFGLTTVAHSSEADGREAARMLIELFLGPDSHRITEVKNRPKLIIRSTTSSPTQKGNYRC
jgi:DNA-binding LacI/PurR family transcriptional regulator/DNA-binding transcriptional regulator YhcF (GntR family)